MPKVIQHNSKVCDLKCISNCEFAVTTELNLVKKKKNGIFILSCKYHMSKLRGLVNVYLVIGNFRSSYYQTSLSSNCLDSRIKCLRATDQELSEMMCVFSLRKTG